MAESKRDQGVRGVLRKMFGASKEEKKSLNSSSSPTQPDGESPRQNLSPYLRTRSDPAVRLGTSSSSPEEESVSLDESNGHRIGEPMIFGNSWTEGWGSRGGGAGFAVGNGHGHVLQGGSVGGAILNGGLSYEKPSVEEHDISSKIPPMQESMRECTLVIHYATYGNEDQALMRSAKIVGDLEMKGTEIIQAMHNDIHITGVREG